MAKRYFWLKLKEDFFSTPLIRAVERGEQGGAVVLFYLKLLTLGIRGEGRLRISDTIPYDPEGLADDTRTDPAIVQMALERLQKIDLLTLMEDGTYFLPELAEMVGSETDKAKIMRKFRENGNNVTNVLPKRYPEKEIDKDKEIESEIEKERKGAVVVGEGRDGTDLRVELSLEQRRMLVEQMGYDRLAGYLEKMDAFTESKGRAFKDPYQTILKWYQEDCGSF